MFLNKEQVSLTCQCICQSSEFQQRFKVLKQISGRIEWSIRRWYRYCSTCGLWLRMKLWGLCKCCGRKVRAIQSARERKNRYLQKNREKVKIAHRVWQQNNKEKTQEYMRKYRLNKKIALTHLQDA